MRFKCNFSLNNNIHENLKMRTLKLDILIKNQILETDLRDV